MDGLAGQYRSCPRDNHSNLSNSWRSKEWNQSSGLPRAPGSRSWEVTPSDMTLRFEAPDIAFDDTMITNGCGSDEASTLGRQCRAVGRRR